MPKRKLNAAPKVKSKPLNTATLSSATSLLADLPEKPNQSISLRDAIQSLQEHIQIALGKGYHFDELSEILGEHQISISPSTLKRYLGNGKKRGAQPRKTKAALPKPVSQPKAKPKSASINRKTKAKTPNRA